MRDDDEEGEERFSTRRSRSSRNESRSEFDFIDSIRQKALRRIGRKTSPPGHHPSSLLFGIGDDAAVIEQRGRLNTVVTSDLLVEEIDFRLRSTTARLLGHKALAVSLSDVAAMGARPRFALLSVGVPREIWRSSFLDELYEGFFALADCYGVALIGGDVSRTPDKVVLDSIVMGETAHGHAVFRSGARPGDHIFVTGSLGGAGLGLRLLEHESHAMPPRDARRSMERAILRHRRPEPRVGWGALLGEERLATAMIDISDGLSSDLSHLCRESRVGARIDAARIPADPALVHLGDRLGLNPLELALDGGEDFELLFTVRPRDLARLPLRVGGVEATYIGDITGEREGLTLRTGRRIHRLRPSGFLHFSNPRRR
jgi:thiamine-monophosphate kinase